MNQTCTVCQAQFEKTNELATQVYRRDDIVVTVTGIPAIATCIGCGNAILDWDTAQEVEAMVTPLISWLESHNRFEG